MNPGRAGLLAGLETDSSLRIGRWIVLQVRAGRRINFRCHSSRRPNPCLQLRLYLDPTGGSIADADAALLEEMPPTLSRLIVHNKIDLLGLHPAVESRARPARNHEAEAMDRHVFLSAKTGAGIEFLRQEILRVAGAHEDMEGAFLARERHLVALRAAGAHLDTARLHVLAARPPLELFAEDLRGAHTALAEVTGEFSSDDLLGVIFSRFCIGK